MKKVPPVPQFATSQQKREQMMTKMEQFIKQVEGTTAGTQKKKQNMMNINQKLANMMKNKKDQIDKIKNEVPKPVIHEKKVMEQEYNPSVPNHYQQCKNIFQFEDQKSKIQTSPIQTIQNIKEQISQQEVQVELSETQQKALKMMQKYGFKIGEGLGKNSSGITTPLVIKKTTDTTCVVVQSTKSMAQIIKPQVSAKIALQNSNIKPTNVVILYDIIKISEFDESVQAQIRQECEKYGIVTAWITYLLDGVLRIFIEYQSVSQSFQTFVHLNQRYYDNKRISVRFYNLQNFKTGNFSASVHDHISF